MVEAKDYIEVLLKVHQMAEKIEIMIDLTMD